MGSVKKGVLTVISTVTRKDGNTVENVELQVHDDTAEATLGLWGTAALSPFGIGSSLTANETTNPEATTSKQGWKPGETVLLLQAPAWKIGRRVSPLPSPPNPGPPPADH